MAQAIRRFYLTAEGKTRFEDELKNLENYLGYLGQKLQRFRWRDNGEDTGDFETTRSELDVTENRTHQLFDILSNAELIDTTHNRLTVELGSAVKLRGRRKKQVKTFRIVGSLEANPAVGNISNESPIGEALLGKGVGEVIAVDGQSGPESWVIVGVH